MNVRGFSASCVPPSAVRPFGLLSTLRGFDSYVGRRFSVILGSADGIHDDASAMLHQLRFRMDRTPEMIRCARWSKTAVSASQSQARA